MSESAESDAVAAEFDALIVRLIYTDCLVCGLPDPERSGVVSCENCLRSRSLLADVRSLRDHALRARVKCDHDLCAKHGYCIAHRYPPAGGGS